MQTQGPTFSCNQVKPHHEVWWSVVPKVLLNQGGDPFLMELYRSIGGS